MARAAILITMFGLSGGLGLSGGAALAEPPSVAADILPVHSLVARVMQGAATPSLVLPPSATPHGHALRPSEAAALESADLVVWTGPALTPWLSRAIDALAGEARSLVLLEVNGTRLLPFRDGAAFEGHGHEHDDAHEHAHDGEGPDPHAWLDPANAGIWASAIADALAGIDPENAGLYRANAEAARGEIDALSDEIESILEPVQGSPFIVFHDAYHYFEHRFGIEASGAIALSDASPPGPARISAIRDLIARSGASCVFAEPQFPTELTATVAEGADVRTATLDPLGTMLEPGPELYPEMMRELAASLRDCLEAKD